MSGTTRESLTGDARFDRDWLLLRVRELEDGLQRAGRMLREAGEPDKAAIAEVLARKGMPAQELVPTRAPPGKKARNT
jgi:hypothetical protein